MIISCGFLIESKGQVLLCHATNECKKWSRADYRWGVAKGQVEPNETYLEAAKREVKEETGLDIDALTSVQISKNYKTINYKNGKKKLKIYKLLDLTEEVYYYPFLCSTFFVGKDGKSFPEIDCYVWVDYATATDICIKGQKGLFDDTFDWQF